MRKSSLNWMAGGLAAVVGLALWWRPAPAGEHPSGSGSEHPTGGATKPKSGDESSKTEPAPASAVKEMTMEELSQAIRGYVEKDSALKGGYFVVFDKVDDKPLPLTLVKVHEDRLSSLGGGVYFACVDMKLKGIEDVYDVDIFMKAEAAGALTTTEIAVHKKNGTARYNWKEEGGVWKKEVEPKKHPAGSGSEQP